MRTFILTIHNPYISFGPNMRLKGFIKCAQHNHETVLRLPFKNSKKNIKLGTVKILIQSLIYIFANRKKIDIIHVVTPPSYTAPIAWVAKKLLKIPYIVDVGDPYAENMAEIYGLSQKKLKFRVLKWLDKLLYKNANHLILASDGLKKYIPLNVPHTTILTGIIEKTDLDKTQSYKPGKRCIFLGQYGPLQNFKYIYEVFEEAIKIDPEIMLDVIGSGDKSELKREHQNIKFHEPIPQEEIKNVISKYACGVVSLKLNENLNYAIPTKLLTYLSHGLPVFGTGGESAQEIIHATKAGHISSKYNLHQDAHQLVKMLKDRDMLKQASKNSIDFAQKNLTYEQANQKLLQIKQQLINKPKNDSV